MYIKIENGKIHHQTGWISKTIIGALCVYAITIVYRYAGIIVNAFN